MRCETLAEALVLKIAEIAATAGAFSLTMNLTPQQLIAVTRKYGYDAIADEIAKL
ncbi:hypothetical protein [Lacipirellula sp.]|uniref:hypothetical protein n=1 Tax=Lacipirellula sp. TaxID=2691419 RepID=UPI003D0BA9EF